VTVAAVPARRRAAVDTLAARLEPLRPSRRFGVRARLIFAFALGSFLSSALLAGVTWALVRDNLIDSRVNAALQQVFDNAKEVLDTLPQLTDDREIPDLLRDLGASPEGSRPILVRDVQPIPAFAEFGIESIPVSLRRVVEAGRPGRMRYTIEGDPNLAVGVPLQSVDAEYYEIVSLAELDDTLNSLSVALIAAGLLTTLTGAAIGWFVSRRVLRPLAEVGHAAEAIAGGNLDTRLEARRDPDLAPLAASFNEMAQALQDRIERDARFASDVSHELRSPLMTLAASIEVLQARRDEMPDRAQRALDLLVADVARFQTLVEDLLEISRIDAGAARLQLDEVLLPELVMQAVAASTDADVPVSVDAGIADLVVEADKRRLVRVIANLVDNAAKYGAGATAVTLRQVPGGVEIAVEDRGPGVPPDERERVFERFARGGEAGRRGSGEGVGLGLALVAEHIRLHGGTVWVEGRRDGQTGARFVVRLPVLAGGGEEPTAQLPVVDVGSMA
jgi:signal transduction histidine kinase